MFHFLIFFLSNLVLAAVPQISSGDLGTILGAEVNGVERFLSVPYALNPAPPRRYQPPMALAAFSPPLSALEMGPVCPQVSGNMFSYNVTDRMSEDCLWLSIWRPNGTQVNANLPIMVFIHGGGFADGSAAFYDLTEYARRGVVAVAFNYRLNLFGFMDKASVVAGGGRAANVGLLDQQFALQWVNKHAGALGGDASQVTIFGESAGGSSVTTHLLLEGSWPFFTRAIAESGGPYKFPTREAMKYAWSNFLGASATDTQLLESSWKELAMTQNLLGEAVRKGVFIPVVGGTGVGALLQEEPLVLFSRGATKPNATILMGGNAYEGRAFTFFENSEQLTMDNLAFTELISELWFSMEQSSLQGKMQFEDFNDYANALPGSFFDKASRVFSDLLFDCGLQRFSNDVADVEGTTVYRYFFTQPTQTWTYSTLGATHTSELIYVFGPPILESALLANESALAVEIQDIWYTFATTGALPWPKYERDGGVRQLAIGVDTLLNASTMYTTCAGLRGYFEPYSSLPPSQTSSSPALTNFFHENFFFEKK